MKLRRGRLFAVSAAALLAPISLGAQTRWRLVDTLSISGANARVEVSSLRRVRIVVRSGDTLRITTPPLPSDSLRRWLDTLSTDLARPDAARSTFANAIALTPKSSGRFIVGYLLGLADSSGTVSTLFTLPADVARLARVLVHAAEAGLRLTDRELQRRGMVGFEPVTRASSEVPAYPDSMRIGEIEDDVLLAFVVDTLGYARLATVRLLQGRHRQFFDAVLAILPAMKFNPATVEGHKYEDMVAIPFSFRLMK